MAARGFCWGRLFPGTGRSRGLLLLSGGGGARLFASRADDFLFLNVECRYLHGNAEADGKFSTNCRTTLASWSFIRRFISVNLWRFILFLYIQNRTSDVLI